MHYNNTDMYCFGGFFVDFEQDLPTRFYLSTEVLRQCSLLSIGDIIFVNMTILNDSTTITALVNKFGTNVFVCYFCFFGFVLLCFYCFFFPHFM